MTPVLLALLLASPSDSLPPTPVTNPVPIVVDTAVRTDSSPVLPDSSKSPAAMDSTARPVVVPQVPGPVGPVMSPGPVQPGPVSSPGPVGIPGPLVRPGPVVVPSTSISFGPSGAIITVDTGAGAKSPSTMAAVGLSLLLPGTGHSWLGFSNRAPAYHAMDLVGWAALFISWQSGHWALSSAAELADRYAGASLGSNPDPALLSAMRSFRSRRPEGGRHGSYDETMVLSGKSTTSEFPDNAAYYWDWGSTENPDNNAHLRAFENQYRRWRASQVALYSAAGTLVVLRLVAAMDVLRLQRSSAARAGVALEMGPTPGGLDARVSWTF